MTRGEKVRAKKRRAASGIRDINPLVRKNWPRAPRYSECAPRDNHIQRRGFINPETQERVEGREVTYEKCEVVTRQRRRRALRAEAAVALLKQYGHIGKRSGLFVGYSGLSRRPRRGIIRTIAANKYRAEYGQPVPITLNLSKKQAAKLTGPRGGRWKKKYEKVELQQYRMQLAAAQGGA